MPNIWKCRVCGQVYVAGVYKCGPNESQEHVCDLRSVSMAMYTTLDLVNAEPGSVKGHADWVGWVEGSNVPLRGQSHGNGALTVQR